MIRKRLLKSIRKIVVAIVGIIVVCVGIVMLFYPGPGWLCIFAGLAILATEYQFLQKFIDKIRALYDKWQDWISVQNAFTRFLFWFLTLSIATLITWLMNGFGFICHLLNWNIDWLVSPFFH